MHYYTRKDKLLTSFIKMASRVHFPETNSKTLACPSYFASSWALDSRLVHWPYPARNSAKYLFSVSPPFEYSFFSPRWADPSSLWRTVCDALRKLYGKKNVVHKYSDEKARRTRRWTTKQGALAFFPLTLCFTFLHDPEQNPIVHEIRSISTIRQIRLMNSSLFLPPLSH